MKIIYLNLLYSDFFVKLAYKHNQICRTKKTLYDHSEFSFNERSFHMKPVFFAEISKSSESKNQAKVFSKAF